MINNAATKRYEIFSVYVKTEDFSYIKTKFENDHDYLKHINDIKEKSLRKTDINLAPKNEILIIQTFSTNNNYNQYPNKYLLIIGRKI